MGQKCAICHILENVELQKTRRRKYRAIYDKGILLIVKSRILDRQLLAKGTFCTTDHWQKAKDIRDFYKQTDFSVLEEYQKKIAEKDKLKSDLEKDLRKAWNVGLSPEYIKNRARDIVICDKAKARYIALAKEIARRLKFQSEHSNKVTVLDVLMILENIVPEKEQTSDDELLKAALAYQETGSKSIFSKLKKAALQRVEQNNPFGDLDSGDPS